MEFLKKHYEKLLLSLLLAGLAVASGFLMVKVNSVRAQLRQNEITIAETQPQILRPPPFEPYQQALTQNTNPPPVNLSKPHLVLNPVKWQRSPDGQTTIVHRTGKEMGLEAVQIDKVRPLNLIIAYERTTGGAGMPRYMIYITREAEPERRNMTRFSRFFTAPDNEKSTETFRHLGDEMTLTIKEVEGPPEEPTALVFELKGGQIEEDITTGPGKPYQKPMDFVVDLQYPPENMSWTGKRLGEYITVEGEPYRIGSVSETQVVLVARNEKQHRITIGGGEAVAPGGQEQREALEGKLDAIHLPLLSVTNLPLTEVVKWLAEESKKYDPLQVGISFRIEPPAPEAAADPMARIEGAIINVQPPLENVTLRGGLKAITDSADKSIVFRVETGEVVFAPGTPAK